MDGLVAGAESVVSGASSPGSGISEWVANCGALRNSLPPPDVPGIFRVNRGRGSS